MNITNWLGFFFIVILLLDENIQVEARRRKKGSMGGNKNKGSIGKRKNKGSLGKSKKKGFLGKIRRKVSTMGRKLLDKPPKDRSRFDKYPIYVMRYHQFIWKRHFKRYLDHVRDGRPKLPNPKCWTIRCWMRRNKFKRYWKWRAPIPVQGKNSPPFLHRRCRLPRARGLRCNREHLRHDYYWRMFMWVGRYGFPKQPTRKRICFTPRCRFLKMKWKRYWKKFWIYTSLVPVIRPYDYNWKFWMFRFGGNIVRLRQVVYPALMAMGQARHLMGGGMLGGMMGGGMMGGMMGRSMHMMHGGRMTIEMKQALITVMQRNLAQTMQIASVSQHTLQRQRMALMMLMQMPAYPSAISAQYQMQAMMRNVQYQQQMQQYRMQMMLQQQIWGMARYLRGSCGCGACSRGHGIAGGIPSGAAMYVHNNGVTSVVNPAMMARRMTGAAVINGVGMGIGGLGGPMVRMPVNPVKNPLELKMRIQALYAKNNLPI